MNTTQLDSNSIDEIEEQDDYIPVPLRDYTKEIQQYMEKYPAFVRIFDKVSLRRYMWDIFSAIVAMHIEEYTVPQYGDYPTDNLAKWSTGDCLKQIEKYCKRFNTNSRGKKELLSDLIKITHYASVAYLKEKNYEHLVIPPAVDEDGNPIPPASHTQIEVEANGKE